MANSEKVSEELMAEIADGPAGSKDYLAQKKRAMTNFLKHVRSVEKDENELSDIVKTPMFEQYVKNYFFGIRVEEVIQDKKTGKKSKTGLKVLPKMGYSKNIKAVLFGVFMREFKVNLADPVNFPNHSDWWQKYIKYLKKEGKGTTKHKENLHNSFNESSMALAWHCLQALLNRADPVKRNYHQQFIPPVWMTRPHVIVQNFNVLQIIQYGVRRGKEGIADLKVRDFSIKEDEIWGLKSYAKEVSEVSKNHADDEESVENCGEIPFLDLLKVSDDPLQVFNPGQFFEASRVFYHPDTEGHDRLFKRPIVRTGYDVWDPKNEVLFSLKEPLGKNKVGEVVSTFCQILDLDHRTNHCVRADCIQTLIRLGIPPEIICKLTGHKDTRSLKSYDPALDSLHKMDMMAAIAQGGAGQRGEHIMLPSVELKRRMGSASPAFSSPRAMLEGPSNAKQPRLQAGDEMSFTGNCSGADFPAGSGANPAGNGADLTGGRDAALTGGHGADLTGGHVADLTGEELKRTTAAEPPVPSFSGHKLRDIPGLAPRKKFCPPLLASNQKFGDFSEVLGNKSMMNTMNLVPDSNFNLEIASVTSGEVIYNSNSAVHTMSVSSISSAQTCSNKFVDNSSISTVKDTNFLASVSSEKMFHDQDTTSILPGQGSKSISRDEFNNNRLNNLEVAFLLSQRTSLLESKVNHHSNFNLELPKLTLAEYKQLPFETSRPLSQPGEKLASVRQEEDGLVCFCGLQPAAHTVLALGPDHGKRFLSCILSGEEKCSFFKWIKTQASLIDQFCNCGLVSSVKTVAKNGPNFGRRYYCCSKPAESRCSYFQFVIPSQHFTDQAPAKRSVIPNRNT